METASIVWAWRRSAAAIRFDRSPSADRISSGTQFAEHVGQLAGERRTCVIHLVAKVFGDRGKAGVEFLVIDLRAGLRHFPRRARSAKPAASAKASPVLASAPLTRAAS